MDRTRSTEPESATAVPSPAHTPAHPAEPGGAAAARLLGYQATGGNQMVLRLLAAAREADGTAPAAPPIAQSIQGRLGGGSPLPADVRAEAEAGFARPLGDVRLHTDPPAAALATRLNAHAFTTGNDIFFNSGVYDPGSRGGYEVLVHELTHTLQQSSAPVAGRLAAEGLSVSGLRDPDEREARAVAARLTARRGARTDAEHAHAGPPAPGAVRSGAAGGGPLTVRRHSSWEHTLLGDAKPDRLGDATVQVQTRMHVLTDLVNRMDFFAGGPAGDPRNYFPHVRWVQLKASALWVSYGELNALADYLSGPEAADTLPAEQLAPVLQKMRTDTRRKAAAMAGLSSADDLAGAASDWTEYFTTKGGELKALNEATAAQGQDRYLGLLARNACHFAPFSWQRWEQYHNEAAEEARKHFANRSAARPLRDVPLQTEEHARQAILKNGYGDHFLQDSFAAGHLVNKTLVMQWWVDYLNQYNREADANSPVGTAYVWPGQPDQRVLERMGSQAQRGVAGRELYNRTPTGRDTKRGDRESGTGVADPQTAQERTDRDRRVSGSGVTGVNAEDREENYQAYLRLLNNVQAQNATARVHDYLNSIGLTVFGGNRGSIPVGPNLLGLTMISGNGTQMRVGGDDTLIAQSDRVGAHLAAEASQLSRQAIDELLNTGKTGITTEQIFAYVPVSVLPDGGSAPVSLEKWQDTTLRDLCMSTIFPAYYKELLTTTLGAYSSEMVPGGVSRDAAPPESAPATKPGVGLPVPR